MTLSKRFWIEWNLMEIIRKRAKTLIKHGICLHCPLKWYDCRNLFFERSCKMQLASRFTLYHHSSLYHQLFLCITSLHITQLDKFLKSSTVYLVLIVASEWAYTLVVVSTCQKSSTCSKVMKVFRQRSLTFQEDISLQIPLLLLFHRYVATSLANGHGVSSTPTSQWSPQPTVPMTTTFVGWTLLVTPSALQMSPHAIRLSRC